MEVDRIELRVTGHEPRPWATGKGEWVWRAAVADAARLARASIGGVRPFGDNPAETLWLSLEIVFRMTSARFRDADLDNLAKPVLDTLFLAKRVQAPIEAGEVSGILFGVDDSRVVRLVLEKRRVESVEAAGIDVVVSTVPGPQWPRPPSGST